MKLWEMTPETILVAGDRLLIEAIVMQPSGGYADEPDGFVAIALGNEHVYAPRVSVRAVVGFDYQAGARVYVKEVGKGTVHWANEKHVLVQIDGASAPTLCDRDDCTPRRADEHPGQEQHRAILTVAAPKPAALAPPIDLDQLEDEITQRDEESRRRAADAIAADDEVHQD